jgi:hypothetical protein
MRLVALGAQSWRDGLRAFWCVIVVRFESNSAVELTKGSAAFISISILILVGVVFVIGPVTTSMDSRWSIHTAMSFIKGNNGALSDYSAIITKDDYAIGYPDGKPRTIYPIGASLLAIPFVAGYAIVEPNWPSYLQNHFVPETEKFIASVLGAIASVVFFWVLFIDFRSLPIALSCTAIFAFATPMWSTASRALWQHGPLVLMLSIAMLLLLAGQRKPSINQFVSIPVALAYIMRPTAITSVFVFTVYIFWCHRDYFLKYIAWACLIALPWIAFNFSVYRRMVPPYYTGGAFDHPNFVEGLFGNLVSPSRGLFVFSPILLFSITGFYFALRDAQHRSLAIAFGSIVGLHCIIIGSASMWWAGHSFGPRFMTDILPFLVYFVSFNFLALSHSGPVIRRSVVSIALVLFAISAGIHSRGATSHAPWLWNPFPKDIDRNPDRAWDWSDPQFLRHR